MTNEPQGENIVVSEEEAWDIVKFARNLYNGMYGISYLNPELVSGRMKDATLNPMIATEEMLTTAMKSPKESEKELQEFSQSFELTSMVYKRLISFLSNMLSFDLTYTSNAKPEEYKTPRYKGDLETVENFLDKFEYKKELRIVTKELLRNDAYFGCMVDTGNKYVLQELPSEYCKITGRWENGFLFSFNMYWFLQPGVDIDLYPKFFKKKYIEFREGRSVSKGYIPQLHNSTWVYWVDVPVDVGVCFKLTPELATRLPYFTPLFNDLVLQSLMRNLQKNLNMAAASKIITGEVPYLNRDTKAAVQNSIAISPDLLGKFMNLVKGAISEAIKVAPAPLEDIKAIDFASDNEMYDKYLRTALASSGVNTNLIFSSNIKPNTVETQLSLNVDEQMMMTLYPQYEDFINYYLNKQTKKFRFKIVFEGTEFSLSRDKRFETAMSLFNQGIVLPQKISASLGMKPWDFRKQMEEAKAFGFMDTLTPPSVQQQKMLEKIAPTDAKTKTVPKVDEKTGEQVKRGRPQKSDSELGEEGDQTRAQGTNVGRGGEV